MIKNIFAKYSVCFFVFIGCVVICGGVVVFLCVMHTDSKKEISTVTHDVLSDIYIPYNYIDHAYDLGVKNCNAPSCEELSVGLSQGDYDKKHDNFIQVIGELNDPENALHFKKQFVFVCSSEEEVYSCSEKTTVFSKEIVNTKEVAVLSYYLGDERDLKVISVTEDMLIARSHSPQSSEGVEYRLNRKSRTLSGIEYENGKSKGEIVYSNTEQGESVAKSLFKIK